MSGAISGAAVHRFRLRLARPLATGAGVVSHREGVLLELRDDAGRAGFGEAAPLPGHVAFAREDAAASGACLQSAARALEGRSAVESLREIASLAPAHHPAARFALETALADLAAQAKRRSLAAWLAGGPTPERVAVNALVAASEPEAVHRETRAAARAGYGCFKLKVGVASAAEDAKRVEALRDAAGPGASIRLDANGAWSPEEAASALRELGHFGVEYVEDPIALREPSDVVALAQLRERSKEEGGAPLAVDEGLSDPALADAVLARGAADSLVLKAAPLGGLGATLEMARRAAAAGMRAVLTSTLDSAVGLTASLHLAAAMHAAAGSGEPPACGLGTASWLAEDVAAAPPVEDGALAVPAGPGLGIGRVCVPAPGSEAG